MGNLDLTNVSSIFLIIALVLGLMVYHVADALGMSLASTMLRWLAPYLPNAAGGSDGGMVRGEL